MWPWHRNKIKVNVEVDTTQLDAATQKLVEFNQLLDLANEKMNGIDKRLESKSDVLDDSGVG